MRLADDVDFDLDTFRGQRTLAQGASGSGKSNLIRLILERSFGTSQHLVIDVEDEFHTLRSPDRPYMILGGENGDSPLTPKHNARELALTLLQVGASVILQIGDWTLDDKRAFIGEFIAGMMSAKNTLWHPTIVVLDEAHNWAPQGAVVDSSEAVTHLATAGRKRGFSMLLATQRLSLISKDVTGVCENKFLGRVEQALDRRSAADLLGFGPTSADAKDMQSFDPGEFYVVGPAVSKLPRRVQLDRAETKAPEPGSTVVPSPTPEAVQKALAALAAATVEPEKEQPSPSAAAEPDPAWIVSIEQRGYERGLIEGHNAGLQDAGRKVLSFAADFALFTRPDNPAEVLRSIVTKMASDAGIELSPNAQAAFDAAAAHASEMVPLRNEPPINPADYEWTEVIPQPFDQLLPTDFTYLKRQTGPDKIKGTSEHPEPHGASNLETKTAAQHIADHSAKPARAKKEDALVTMARKVWPAKLTWAQLAGMAGRKASGGHFNSIRKRLLQESTVREEGQQVVLCAPPELPGGVAAADLLQENLPSPANKMFRAIREAGAVTPDVLAKTLGMVPRGGHWTAGMSTLRKNGFISELSNEAGLAPRLMINPDLEKKNG